MKRLALLVLVCFFCTSCDEPSNRKETFPVTGTITVDGEPGSRLSVSCHPKGGMDKENPTVSSAFTDEQGNFEISTYETGDGIPAGQYTLTITWGTFSAFKGGYSGDKFDGKYSDPETSEFEFTVEPGVATPPLKLELTTKE